MVELFAQFALINEFREADRFGAVDQRKCDICVGTIAKDRLAHQKLIEIGVDQRAYNRVDFPFVVPDACGDINHCGLPLFLSELEQLTRKNASKLRVLAGFGNRGESACSHLR